MFIWRQLWSNHWRRVWRLILLVMLLMDGVGDLHRHGDRDMVLTHVLHVHGALLPVLRVLHLLIQGLTSEIRSSILGSVFLIISLI